MSGVELDDLSSVSKEMLKEILGAGFEKEDFANGKFTPQAGSLLFELNNNVASLTDLRANELKKVGEISKKVDSLIGLYNRCKTDLADLKKEKNQADASQKEKLGKDISQLKLYISTIKQVIEGANGKLKTILDNPKPLK